MVAKVRISLAEVAIAHDTPLDFSRSKNAKTP
jgi:hypothetical protein